MFSNRVASSAKFLQMPSEAQLLFFHMVLRADDDGIVESYPLMKLLGTPPDNFKVLIAKGFIKQINEDQVVVIEEWLEHNTIRADRKVNSFYLPAMLEKYPDTKYVVPKPRKDVDDNSKRVDSPRPAEGKLSKGKVTMVAKATEIYTTSEEDSDRPQRKLKVTPEMQSVFDLFTWNPARYHWKLYESERLAAQILFDNYGLDKLRSRLKLAREQKQTVELSLSINCPSKFLQKMIDLEEQQQRV